jgi:hypothetical protein
MNVDTARSTDEAFKWMGHSPYDIVITNLNRLESAAPCTPGASEPQAGCYFLREMENRFASSRRPPAIVYTGDLRPELGTPAYAIGITNSPVELFDLILTVLEKRDVKP